MVTRMRDRQEVLKLALTSQHFDTLSHRLTVPPPFIIKPINSAENHEYLDFLMFKTAN